MYCPNCGNFLSFKKNRCDKCNEDLRIYKRVLSLSNRYYNDGLMKAKIRDLSGAVYSLKQSLRLDKRNTAARNLLGLVYYEMGETVSALSQWVLSRHFQEEENDAELYIDSMQANPARLETLNQTIKKFNSALASAGMGSDDLAMIQLKKVITMNPKFLRALQLMALLCIKAGERERAAKYLNRAIKIDINNTTTLRYLRELKLETEAEEAEEETAASGEHRRKKETPKAYVPVGSYKEDKPNVFLFINLVIGVVIGVLVMYILIKPTIIKRMEAENRSNVVDYSQELAGRDAKISTLEEENADLKEQRGELEKQNQALAEAASDEALYDGLFQAARLYVEKGDEEAADMLSGVEEKSLERPEAKKLYRALKEKTFEEASGGLYEEGHSLYSAGRYEEALVPLLKAIKLDPDNVDAIYFAGRAYDRLGDRENAREYYERIVDQYPDSSRAAEAQQKLGYTN